MPEAETSAACAQSILDTLPLVMRALRKHERGRENGAMPLPQLRILFIVHHHPGASLSLVAEHLGLGMPSASKLVDGLVRQHLLEREASASDRRKIELKLTPAGHARLKEMRKQATQRLGGLLEGLEERERKTVNEAMRILRAAFAATGLQVPVEMKERA